MVTVQVPDDIKILKVVLYNLYGQQLHIDNDHRIGVSSLATVIYR